MTNLHIKPIDSIGEKKYYSDFSFENSYWNGNDITIKAMATVININVIFRSVFRCFCCRLRVETDINEVSTPGPLFVVVTAR